MRNIKQAARDDLKPDQNWDVIADIGGSNARIAAVVDGEIQDLWVTATQNAKPVPDLLADYIANRGRRPDRACIAVAAPILEGVVHMTNGMQSFDIASFSGLTKTGVAQCLNDFEAAAWAMHTLREADVIRLQGSREIHFGNRLVIGPGTGLGTGVLAVAPPAAQDMPTPRPAIAVAGEGGHVGLSPQSDFEVAVFDALREIWPEVFFGARRCLEAEALLGGVGLPMVYRAICRVMGRADMTLTPAEIFASAAPECAAKRAVISMFRDHLGQLAGDLALSCMAQGGAMIAGGIAAKNPWLFDEQFLAAFNAGGRFSTTRAQMPVYLVRGTDFGLVGARNAAMALRPSAN